MSSSEEIAESGDSDNEKETTPEPKIADTEQSPAHSALSHRFREASEDPDKDPDPGSEDSDELPSPTKPQKEPEAKKVSVMIAAPARPWEYQPYQGDTTVDTILEEIEGSDDERWFRIEYEDGEEDEVPLSKLIKLRNGENAMAMFNDEEEPTRVGKRTRTQTPVGNEYVNSTTMDFSDEDGMSHGPSVPKKRRLLGRAQTANNSRQSSRRADTIHDDDDEDDSDDMEPKSRGAKSRGSKNPLSKMLQKKQKNRYVSDDEDELAGDNPEEDEDSDIVYEDAKSKKQGGRLRTRQQINYQEKTTPKSESRPQRTKTRKASTSSDDERPEPSRRSERSKPTKNMRERDMDEEMYADEVVVSNLPKVISIREVYQPLAKDDPFRRFHRNECEVCLGVGNNSNKGSSPLIYCQGCSSSIHKVCLGYRSGRDHMVTKIGDADFVMQCRRCIGIAAKKDPLAPLLGACQSCKKEGLCCKAFSAKKTPKQEEKLREENDGQDPITKVSPTLINNANNVLFRCMSCHMGYHFEHLPSPSPSVKSSLDQIQLRELRLKQYSSWQCHDCIDVPAKVQTVVAWRPADRESYEDGQNAEDFREDEREYLIKWEAKSYFQCSWRSGGWVWGVTAAVMRNAFFRRDEGANLLPKWTNEEAIPEEYLRMEIIFEVNYKSVYRSKSEKSDKAAINAVDEVLVKFQGLGYEESVWEVPPSPHEKERWSDFVAAYNEFIAGKYFKHQAVGDLKSRVEDFRDSKFKKMEKQPSSLVGGEMMKYQLDGMNWLLENFHDKKNVILADEMGLGKTIQIVALLAALVKHNPKCWPFLVVTPNSTCPNWRREIKKWAPDLRVVAFYGGARAREMAMEHELYPEGSKEMSAHVVITSYEGPVNDSSRAFFRKIKWQGMIVDEGQRLKNDENLLYAALKALKTPFQVLLTGTPLQNNKRELFNLLQFLDTSINAAELDKKYAELNQGNVGELHELIRPFFLRRTKLQVLKFLPPMAQVILPVSMSVVQKKLYKSILARNPQLIKSIFGKGAAATGPKDKSNLNNILMQLRKCLCHPFVYSNAIEERGVDDADLHRNLIDASSKFQLLEIMLPKLRERGHRVLIFSQFLFQLDLIEDFLTGLGLPHERLDGTIGALEKQRRIDLYNAPDSPLFAFLLSTRSGGVGINLATADTVIIMDPDFNPHQDIQALSRAHRIGQKNKVLCFQLMTKDSAEEKMVQIGRKKMALDQALIESMDAAEDDPIDVEGILKFGAEALFNDDDTNDIRYDSASVDKLLDRTQVENAVATEDKTAESQFAFARVWANDKATLAEDLEENEAPPNPLFWENLLKEREANAAAEAARNAQTFGRGKRARFIGNYEKEIADEDLPDSSPHKKQGVQMDDKADSDFGEQSEPEVEEDEYEEAVVNLQELAAQVNSAGKNKDTPVNGGPVTSGGETLNGFTTTFSHGQQNFLNQQNPIIRQPGITTSKYPQQGHQGPPIPYGPGPYGATTTTAPRKVGENGVGGYLPPLATQGRNGRAGQPGSAGQPSVGASAIQKQALDANTRNFCPVCKQLHAVGHCPLGPSAPSTMQRLPPLPATSIMRFHPPMPAPRIPNPDYCGLCGIAHFAIMKSCPHLSTEAGIRLVLDALQRSSEPQPVVQAAMNRLRMELVDRDRKKKAFGPGPR